MILRPVDIPLLRDETAEWVDRTGHIAYGNAIRDGRQTLRPLTSPDRAAAILAANEVRRLKEAELFYVSAPMTELAIAAGRTLPEFTLMPEDLPSPTGMIVFEKPFAAAEYSRWYPDEGDSPIVAATWSHWTGNNPAWVRGGVWVTWYADRDGSYANAVKLGRYTRQQLEWLRTGVNRLLIDNEAAAPFSPDPVPALKDGRDVPISEADGLARWMATLRATWLLMAQPITNVEDAHYDRAARRRIQKQGKQPPRVRVITLRRPAATGASGTGDREYHHQWVVRGHWRQQWYPARQLHRPVWIAPHIKGPEGAPVLGGEKVQVWSR